MWGTVAAVLLAMTVTVTPPGSRKTGDVAAGAQKFSGEYTVSFLGLPVARSNFESVISGDRFTVNGQVSSAGVGRLFDSTVGNSKVSGSFVGKATRADSFRIQYKSGKETQTTAIRFVGGNVAKTVNVPPLRKRSNWVALKAADLRSVSDPISATLIRADGPGDVCNRTLRVYDGQMRVNLQLSYVSKGPVSGYDGEAVTCSAKFIPVSGYRSNNRSVSYLRDRAKISVSFAPLGETGVYAPVRASVSTTIGTVTVNARRTKS